MRWVFSIMLLASCSAAGPQFRGVPAQEVTVDGLRFALRLRDTQAEAIRLTPMARPRWQRVQTAAISAVEQTSGCRVVRIEGDVAMLLADLDCTLPGEARTE